MMEQLIWHPIPMLKDPGSIPAFGQTFSNKLNRDSILSDNCSTCLYFRVEKGADLIISANIVGIVNLPKACREYNNCDLSKSL